MDNFETIGTILKRKREEKNISLDMIAQKTKININILKQLESDEFEKLPNLTYVKGFVANYASTIGWNQTEAKEALKQTYESATGETQTSEPAKTHLGSLQVENQVTEENDELKETFISITQSFFSKKALVSIAAVLVLAAIGKGVVAFFSQINYERKDRVVETSTMEPKIEKSSAENTNDSAVEDSQTEQVVEETQSSEEKSETEEPVQEVTESSEQPEETKKEEKVEEEPVVVTAKGKLPFKKFYQAPLNTFEVVEDSPEAANPNLLPDNVRLALDKNKQNVYLKATDGDTWIAYQADDQPIKKYVLRKGRGVFIKGSVVKVFMGNYNVAKVFYNNQLIKAYTRTGVKSLIFPENAGKDLKLPLFPTFNGRSYTSAEYIEKMNTQSSEI